MSTLRSQIFKALQKHNDNNLINHWQLKAIMEIIKSNKVASKNLVKPDVIKSVCENCGEYESIHSANRRICPGGKGYFKQTVYNADGYGQGICHPSKIQ